MGTTLVLAAEDRVLTVRPDGTVAAGLTGLAVTCVTLAPGPRLYAGTDGAGLWRSDDRGGTWHAVGETLRDLHLTAVAAGPVGRRILYAGTEPSRILRSEDGGDTWEDLEDLQTLPSASSWSFPPRPQTHHVRWILVDPADDARVFAAIEAGALIRSPDGGRTWRDRTRGSPYDTHTLAAHPLVPGRLYAAAGDGYFESRDAGETWIRPRRGLQHSYLVGATVHSREPDAVLVSAAPGPRTSYAADGAESYVYRRVVPGGAWEMVRAGFPDPQGTTVSALAASPREPGVVYAANNRGIFRSDDFGGRWQELALELPRALRTRWVQGLAVIEDRPDVPPAQTRPLRTRRA